MTRTLTAGELLTAGDAVVYLLNTDKRLMSLLAKHAADPTNVEKRDAVLDQIHAMEDWLAVARRAVLEGRLGV